MGNVNNRIQKQEEQRESRIQKQEERRELEGKPVTFLEMRKSLNLTHADQEDEARVVWHKLKFNRPQFLRFIHMSDTHGMHDQIEMCFPFPDCDLDFLLHTGDMTDHGSLEELRSVNRYFGEIQHRFKHGIIVIAGNHDVRRGNDLKQLLTNATVLDHEVAHQLFEACDLKIFGSPWCLGKPGSDPGGDGHLFDLVSEIEGIDILMTHGPPSEIFDTAGYTVERQQAKGKKQKGRKAGYGQDVIHCHPWGSCDELNAAIMCACPRVHLFGHLHEQRGVWQRDASGHFTGGVEYQAEPGEPFPTTGPPPEDWPCDLVSCNAMCNHADHEGAEFSYIAGPPRLILASRSSAYEPWKFDAVESR